MATIEGDGEHFNIQIHIQKVTVTPVGTSSRGISAAVSGKDRKVNDILRIGVTAETADKAINKAKAFLDVEQLMLGPGGEISGSSSTTVR